MSGIARLRAGHARPLQTAVSGNGGSGALGGAQRAPPVCFANTLVRLFAPQGQTLLTPRFRSAQPWPLFATPQPLPTMQKIKGRQWQGCGPGMPGPYRVAWTDGGREGRGRAAARPLRSGRRLPVDEWHSKAAGRACPAPTDCCFRQRGFGGAWRRTTSAASLLRKHARAVVCPAGANIARSPVSLRSTVAPRSQPRNSRLKGGGRGGGVKNGQ